MSRWSQEACLQTKGLNRILHATTLYIGALLRHGLVYLPLIIFLASLTVLLEQRHAFRTFDDGVLAVVASIKGPPSIELTHPDIAAVLISRKMFETELGRRLPIDKVKLTAVIGALAELNPKVIAVDIDAIPRESQSPDKKDVLALPIYQIIAPLLQRGISVVAVSYPRSANEEAGARAWRQQICEASSELLTNGEVGKPGKLWWASTWLQAEGRGLSVIRYHDPKDAEALRVADASLLPLGMVLYAAAGIPGPYKEKLERLADYCAESKKSPTQSGAHPRAPDPIPFINYFGDKPAEIEIESSDELRLMGATLKNKAVVLGVRSFEGVDEHVTPLGRLAGATVHALVAASIARPLVEGHASFLVDVAAGYVFTLLFLLLRDVGRLLKSRWPDANYLNGLLSGLSPLLAWFVVAIALLASAPNAAAAGLWLNPLPMLIGLLVHLYVELAPHQEEEGGSARPHSLVTVAKNWRRRVFTTATQWRRFNDLSMAVRADVLAWTIMQSAMFLTVFSALRILLHGD
jgi:hypothetical protein